MINKVDFFVFLDDVQYTKHDWRNRNKIKTPNGLRWITVPVKSNSIKQKINEVEVSQRVNWQKKHYNSFIANYSKAKYFKDFEFLLEDFYITNKWKKLSDLDIYTTIKISEILRINTNFLKSSEFKIKEKDKNRRLIEIIKLLKGKIYITGPSAKNYLNIELFEKNGIEVRFMEYKYPEYQQLYEGFIHEVTVLDVLFNCGDRSPFYIFT
ncbi:WbqC-like protein family [Thermosipho melanesiensis BI429]|uniref:WbqC-like protein family n=3 Tax=Thermosipho melanesiensis TaxID=46541 RepID=A6LKC1_THEM4|nr:WbqC-like protein family [Thermosipho melanesiensis BI429]